MIIDNFINTKIDAALIAANAEHDATHEPSGKLSASMLYMPVRFQIFKAIGVPKKPIEPYVLGKFKRGNDVEDWYVGQLGAAGVLLERQKKIEYRDVIGYIDAVCNSDLMFFKQGVMPHEVKSVTNAKLKRIATAGVDYHYQMQACLYALALGSKYYAVDIVSAEDLRPNVYICETASMAGDVDQAIDNYNTALKNWKENKNLPPFAANPKVPWTATPEYWPYEEWWGTATDEQVVEKLQTLGLL